MKISIITICKNAERFIEKALASVAAQTFSQIEYLVIDGASRDGTKGILARYAPHITKLVSEPDRGLYNAMNKGIRLATGDYLYFLNADDYLYDENVIRDVAQFLSSHSGCDAVYGDIEMRRPSGTRETVTPPPPHKIADQVIRIYGGIHHQSLFVRAGLFQELGLYNERLRVAADYEWFVKLIQRPSVQLHYLARIIASYSTAGRSSDVAVALPELFAVLDQAPLFRTERWYKKRIRTYQEEVLWLHRRQQELARFAGAAEPSIVSQMLEELQQAKLEIAVMKSSKFWKLRSVWMGLKRLLRAA